MIKIGDKFIFMKSKSELNLYYTNKKVYTVLEVGDTRIIMSDNIGRNMIWGINAFNDNQYWEKDSNNKLKPTWF